MPLIFKQRKNFKEYAFSAITCSFFIQIDSNLILELRSIKNKLQKIFIDLKKFSIETIQKIEAEKNILYIFSEQLHKLNLNTFLMEKEKYTDEILKKERRKLDLYDICNYCCVNQLIIYGTKCGKVLIENSGHITGIYNVRQSGIYVLVSDGKIYIYGELDHRIAKLSINITQYLHKKLKLNNDNKNNAQNLNIIENQRSIFPVPIDASIVMDNKIYLLHREGSISTLSFDLKYDLNLNSTENHFFNFTFNEEIKIQSENNKTVIYIGNEKFTYDQPIISYFQSKIYFIDGYLLNLNLLTKSVEKIDDFLEPSIFSENTEYRSVIRDGKKFEIKNNRLTVYENKKIIQQNDFSKNYLFNNIYFENDDLIIKYDFYRTFIDKYNMKTEFKYKTK